MGWGQRGEMTQALYAHMNNKRKKITGLKEESFWAASNYLCLDQRGGGMDMCFVKIHGAAPLIHAHDSM
jgi:hypothetical protein